MSKRACMITLHPDVGILDSNNKSATVASLVRFMFARPGRSSAIYEDLLLSYRDAESEAKTVPQIGHNIKAQLEAAIKRYYPTMTTDVEVTMEDSDIKEDYSKLVIRVYEVTTGDQRINLLTDAVVVKTGDDLHPFTINFTGV